MTVSARRKDDGYEPELGYEQARDELIEVVRKLEAGGLSLEESLTLWERGEALAATCERQLAGARDRVEAALSRAEESPENPEK
ncbi:MAG TPA: exodeoxyribonuclease VII small subunit [Pseudonocardiaceae bacterium]|jgi:exodeoxyribonuclease VII small subunit|nr:exodeoxyribonuclease VII small subunit [Pseudonocardiaceae bacterium]